MMSPGNTGSRYVLALFIELRFYPLIQTLIAASMEIYRFSTKTSPSLSWSSMGNGPYLT